MSQVTSYSWDEENRMVGVVHPDGSSESFTYSGDGQRRSKSRYTPQSTLSDLINYVWDGENILQEVDGTTGETKAHYTDSPGYWGNLTSVRTDVGTPVSSGAQFNTATFGTAGFNQTGTITLSTGGQSFYYHFDQQSSTRLLTDEAGDVTDSYTYRAFGEEVENIGSTPNPHRFQGEVGPYTEAKDRVWVRARSYVPELGVWLSVDPIGFDAIGYPDSAPRNYYSFNRNSPFSFVDPDGRAPIPKEGRKNPDHPCWQRSSLYCLIAVQRNNRAENGFCRVSSVICASFITNETLDRGTRNWADCTNRCMYNHYIRKDLPEWRRAVQSCKKCGEAHRDCCKSYIYAEQKGFDACQSKCKRYGNPLKTGITGVRNPSATGKFLGLVVPFPFGGTHEERWKKGVELVCDGEWGDPLENRKDDPGFHGHKNLRMRR